MTTSTITFAGLTGLLGKGVSLRELQCLLAVAAGLNSKEVGRELGIAAGTVDKRVFHASTKLGVTRRAALVTKAFAMGLISFSGGMLPTPQHQEQDQHAGVLIA